MFYGTAHDKRVAHEPRKTPWRPPDLSCEDTSLFAIRGSLCFHVNNAGDVIGIDSRDSATSHLLDASSTLAISTAVWSGRTGAEAQSGMTSDYASALCLLHQASPAGPVRAEYRKGAGVDAVGT